MADLSITASDVLGDGSNSEILPAGEVIAAGEVVYKSNSTWLKGDCDDSTSVSTKSVVVGMALNSALIAGQKVKVQKEGVVTVGGTVAVGTLYILSGTAGKICPYTDIATNDWVTIIGVGWTTTSIKLFPKPFLIKKAA